MKPVLSMLVILLLAAGSWPEAVARRVVPAIYVFGDSTADVGNNNYLPNGTKVNYRPYGIDYPGGIPTGRFCNGYVAVDFMAMRLGFRKSPRPALSIVTATEERRGVSYASGGSGVFDQMGQNTSIPFNVQIRLFEETVGRLEKRRGRQHSRLFLSRSIFVFSTVNNDVFAFFRSNPLEAANATFQDRYISLLSTQFQQQLERLYGLGARKMAVFGTGPLGCPPGLRRLSPTGDCVEALNVISQKFNVAMKEKLRALSLKLNGFKYSYINSYDINREIVDRAHEFGFKETKIACCGGGFLNAETFCLPNSTYCLNRNEYLSWDAVHPTEAQYKRFIDLVYSGTPRFFEPISLSELVHAHI